MSKMQLVDEQWVPARYEVCGRCRGKGTHTNPSIDGNGITQSDREDWADDDFMEDYKAGHYDIQCEECKGERVILVPDQERCTPSQWAAWERQCQEEAEYRAERAAELKYGY